ncbi:MAG: MBL fold metallo-hydrolase [Thermodesulfobacteriota bacterium]|nr:MBL fold metallo-hydrolase [Thermodesulfobacteriota bacterium]
MNVRLTTLCDNLVGSIGFIGEWGFSILVECGEEKILLDTGMTGSVVYNAVNNGIDLNQITRIVISHGHLDHTGGLRNLLQVMRKNVEIIIHPEAWAKKYATRPETTGSQVHFIGIPFVKAELENLGASFTLSREPVWINDHIVTTGEVPMKTSFESIDNNLFVKTEEKLKQDKVLDDQALIINTLKGLIVVLGCGHHGMINTLMHAQEITGVKKILAVLGGTHLFRSDSYQINQSIAKLQEFKVEKIGVSHCTGMPAAMALMNHFGNRFFFNHVGKVTEF